MVLLYEDTVPFVPNVKEAEVIKVYDGDTFTIGFFYPGSDKPYRMSVRLSGIDAPEMAVPRSVLKAKASQKFLSSKILGRTVQLHDLTTEKYGRLLAKVYCDGVFINGLMLLNHHAVPYDGGSKIQHQSQP